MKSISSSFFGRLFGNRTKIIIDDKGLTILVKKQITEISWQAMLSPPQFIAGWFGQTISFSTLEQQYVLSKLDYSSDKKQQETIETLWIENHKNRLQTLINKVDSVIRRRYLRQSAIKKIQLVVNTEYQRWFPWAKSSRCLQQTGKLTQLLADYHRWQQSDFDACRETYIQQQLSTYQRYFDTVETNPLTPMQRRACIIDDDNNLLLAGAGTGKTSVMVGRTGYLLNSGQANNDQLLLLAYGRKAADEMDQRIKEKLSTDKVSATTFHSLGLTIIAQVEGAKPNLSRFAEDEKAKAKWVQSYFEYLIEQQAPYRKLVLGYFSQYYYVEKNEFDFKTLGEYYQYLTDNDIRTLKGELVKSFGQLHIANWLFTHGVEYQYEVNYQVEVSTIERKQYQPDFFLPELNLYIEYYGIDENGETASYIDQEKYHQSMQWKRDTHQKNSTQCIEFTYAQHRAGTLLPSLKEHFEINAFECSRLSDQAMLVTLRETGRITLLAEIFTKLVGLYKAACLDASTEKQVIANAVAPQQTEKVFALLTPIIDKYQATLTKNGEIDFEDMINKALNYINAGLFKSPWRYIMVDEFQDISEPRARLVKALRDNNQDCSVFAVGDDWQAIYRFSGADVSLTTGFSDYFGATTQTELDQTFRFNNKIGEVATAFVGKNPAQIDKIIHSKKQVSAPAVSILRRSAGGATTQNQPLVDEMANGAIDDVLAAITAKSDKKTSVYLLARFWFQLPNKGAITKLNQKYPMLTIQTQSFHTAKGKEADYVVILGLKSGKHGFPSTKATPPILEALLAKQEDFEHAEERRLFYVALTRAKDRSYIIADMTDASTFVKELIAEHDVELNEFGITVNQAFVEQIRCLICETGTLKPRVGRYGNFYSCSHFPRCDHKERACEKCASVMTKNRFPGFKTCLNPTCNDILPVCEKCGAEMVLRKSNKGEFWGCRNYKGNDPLSCKNGIDKAQLQWPKIKV
ncbi:hypothetical protein GCM10007916_26200 [Psychromonas marina]|uniref:DNA 3'-5' helicase n=1 Tax=Psychromonas marina TaxID=88364 RepID=A0ABQ6E2F8_9GAMM|nr:UvrD-helicase domain-containing protein [Psychromonas marina]GLS91551.1 hypothetical protein GCM10007916_26200 [Psychromonas marina]